MSVLAVENPEKFTLEWKKRLESWARSARVSACGSFAADGNRSAASFHIVDKALAELAACGDEAYELASSLTVDVLEEVCCRAFANEVDCRLYSSTNFRLYRQGHELARHEAATKGAQGSGG